ncbi:hypothetical protein VPH35_096039 [Triticum aestivum]|uniref:TF-B3 domain-containing protein n=2 Tax=Triticinae TaxID=1648030 RepID=A0A453JTD6_AEGTS|nr:B3 domain-containing protein LOC_Os12g40090-like [Triticum aestivum]XP_044395340.1 B3 domain-containing protein LOC_Os12g40090-like [Triticum aestivum]XP_045084326.1 B3 domain-containing protein LOC_Os12g40090 [Aegilops tauschii subsp. strangulata]
MLDGLDDMDGVEDVRFDELIGMQGVVFHLVGNAITRIPDKFASSFIRQMQTSEGLDLKLKAPSGETWHVGVSKVANELFLRSGWGGFAKAHELQENDLLLFTCTGNASFEVLIFDPSGCEKLSPLFAGRMRKHFDNMVGQGGVEQYPDSDDTRVPSQFVGSPQKASTSRKCSGKTKSSKELPESPSSTSCHVKLEATEEQKSDDDTCTEPGYYSSRTASQLNEDEKQEIMERASIRPGNPAFVVVLLMTHLQRKNNFLTIPSKFAADHLQSKPREVLLLRLSREDKWHVRCYYSSRTRCFNCQRWVKFVRDNGLREGDVCVFELIKGARKMTTMTVHVARRKKDGRFVAGQWAARGRRLRL